MKTVLKWGFWFWIVVVFVVFLEVGSARAASIFPPSPKEQTLEGAIEQFGQAPWIFLGQVQSVEPVTDPLTPFIESQSIWRSHG